MVLFPWIKAWPKVAIIILNWNGWKDTIECLESVQRLTYPNYQVIVVYNGSTDDSVAKIKTWANGEISIPSKLFDNNHNDKPVQWVEYDRVTAETGGVFEEEVRLERGISDRKMVLIQTGENLGFAAGNNVGIRYALKNTFTYIGVLNNDCVIHCEFLSRLVATLENHPEIAAVSPKILHKDDPTSIFYAGGWIKMWQARWGYVGYKQRDAQYWNGIHLTDFVSGACFIARSELFKIVGLYDEDFFFSNEEMAFGYKARSHGFLLAVDLDAVVYHKEGSSYRDSDVFRKYYATKYRLLMLKKYGKLHEKVLGGIFYTVSRMIDFVNWLYRGEYRLIKAEIKGIRDFLWGKFGNYDRQQVNKNF